MRLIRNSILLIAVSILAGCSSNNSAKKNGRPIKLQIDTTIYEGYLESEIKIDTGNFEVLIDSSRRKNQELKDRGILLIKDSAISKKDNGANVPK